mmetsp:Transcript_20852/g.62221  ORF Transcript_20852/g.62221 Transcript_20852/m.62221 type:complete len:260 (-) Transcript_20852:32-811(-)
MFTTPLAHKPVLLVVPLRRHAPVEVIPGLVQVQAVHGRRAALLGRGHVVHELHERRRGGHVRLAERHVRHPLRMAHALRQRVPHALAVHGEPREGLALGRDVAARRDRRGRGAQVGRHGHVQNGRGLEGRGVHALARLDLEVAVADDLGQLGAHELGHARLPSRGVVGPAHAVDAAGHQPSGARPPRGGPLEGRAEVEQGEESGHSAQLLLGSSRLCGVSEKLVFGRGSPAGVAWPAARVGECHGRVRGRLSGADGTCD